MSNEKKRKRTRTPRPDASPILSNVIWTIMLSGPVWFLAMMLVPGPLYALGGRVLCPKGTATIAVEDAETITTNGKGRRERGHSYTIWCLDAEGTGDGHGTAIAWLVAYALALPAAGLGLAGYRVVARLRGAGGGPGGGEGPEQEGAS